MSFCSSIFCEHTFEVGSFGLCLHKNIDPKFTYFFEVIEWTKKQKIFTRILKGRLIK